MLGILFSECAPWSCYLCLHPGAVIICTSATGDALSHQWGENTFEYKYKYELNVFFNIAIVYEFNRYITWFSILSENIKIPVCSTLMIYNDKCLNMIIFSYNYFLVPSLIRMWIWTNGYVTFVLDFYMLQINSII